MGTLVLAMRRDGYALRTIERSVRLLRFAVFVLWLSVLPEILEPIRSHFGISNRVHGFLVAHVVLKGSGVMPIVGKLVAGGVPEHMRVDRERELCGFSGPGNYFQESRRSRWTAPLGDEDISRTPDSRDAIDAVPGFPCRSADEHCQSRLWLGAHAVCRCRVRFDPNGDCIPPRRAAHAGMSAGSWWRHGAHSGTACGQCPGTFQSPFRSDIPWAEARNWGALRGTVRFAMVEVVGLRADFAM